MFAGSLLGLSGGFPLACAPACDAVRGGGCLAAAAGWQHGAGWSEGRGSQQRGQAGSLGRQSAQQGLQVAACLPPRASKAEGASRVGEQIGRQAVWGGRVHSKGFRLLPASPHGIPSQRDPVGWVRRLRRVSCK